MGTTNLDSLTLGGDLVVAGTETITGGVTYSGNVTLGDAASDTITVNGIPTLTTTQKIQFRDTGIYLNSSSDGVLNIVSDTSIAISGASTFTGALTVGVDDTGYDVKFFGATASNYWLWDESENKVVQTFISASTSTVEPHTITSTLSGVGVTGGRFKHALTINAAAGSYTNAIKGDVTYGASGRTDGLGSAVLAEMTLSAGTTQGNYAPLECELNLGSNAPVGTATAFAYMSANGTATNFITSGYVLNLQGLGAATSGKIFQANTAGAASHALRILIGSTPYYIMLTDTGA